MEEKKAPFKPAKNTVYRVTLLKKFGEYDSQYGTSYGYSIDLQTDLSKPATRETYFASQTVEELIKAAQVGYEKEFELILNNKDSKNFWTLDGRTKIQWAANKANEEAEKPQPTVEEKVKTGEDELDALFGESKPEPTIGEKMKKIRQYCEMAIEETKHYKK